MVAERTAVGCVSHGAGEEIMYILAQEVSGHWRGDAGA